MATENDQQQGSGTAPGAGAPGDNTEKHPDEWVTGDEPMTGAQASYLRTLCQEAGEDFDEALSKADASKRIDELQSRTGRGQSQGGTGGATAGQGQLG
jgi:hypothetical protein